MNVSEVMVGYPKAAAEAGAAALERLLCILGVRIDPAQYHAQL